MSHYDNTPNSMQHAANFHGCKIYNFQMKNCYIFTYFCSKHRSWGLRGRVILIYWNNVGRDYSGMFSNSKGVNEEHASQLTKTVRNIWVWLYEGSVELNVVGTQSVP